MKHIAMFFLAALALTCPRLAAQQHALEVLVSSPKGPTQTIDQTQTIFVSFNQSMVPLKEVPQDESSGPLFIEPKVPGKYRWLGTTTLAFIPGDTLPNATLFTVRVPSGLQSLSGQRLEKEYTWQFETPRPRVINASPYNAQRFVELDHNVYLYFNQALDPQQASAFISIEEVQGGQVLYPAFKARHATPEELKQRHVVQRVEQSLVLVPDKRWLVGASCSVRCRTGLPGTEGPLGMAVDYVLGFSTYNEFRFVRLRNADGFSPAQSLQLIFSNPASRVETAKHLVLDPPVKIDYESISYDYETEEVYLSVPLMPETQYHATIQAGLKDRFGQELKEDAKFDFRTGSYKPYVRMTTGQGVIEAYESHRYPVRLMNIDSVLVQMGKVSIDRIVPLMQRLTYDYYSRLAWEQGIWGWDNVLREEAKELGSSKLWHVHLARNEEATRPIELDEVLGKSSLGVVFLQVDNLLPSPDRRYLKALLQVTNLGITAKFSPENNLIWVTNLKDATPVAGASVEVRNDSNQVLWTGKTGADGTVKTPGWGKLGISSGGSEQEEWYSSRQHRQWVVATHADDVAFTCSDWNNGIEPWVFGVSTDWNPKFEPMKGSIFTDRGLYKASEQVEIKGVVRVRKEGSWKIPAGRSLRLVVRNPRNEEIFNQEQELSPFGSFAAGLPLKPNAPLGYYRMVLEAKYTRRGKEAWENIGYGQFRVEAFRAAEFEVTATAARKSYIVGDTVAGFITARYLFGAPVKNERVAWRVSVSQSSWHPDGYEGYYFGPIYWLSRYTSGFGYRLLASGEGTLDDQGSIRVSSNLKVGEVRGTVSLLLEGDVTSPSRQQLSGRTAVIVHGGEYYIGISPSKTFLKSDSLLTYKLITPTPEGVLVAGNALTVKVIQRIWRSVRKAETGGRYTWISEEENIVVDSTQVESASSPVELSFRTKQAGFYFIEATGKDARGNEVLSNAYFYVSGSSYVAWERTNDDRIELVANKTDLVPGETASIIVKSPYEQAIALISLEREGILRHYTAMLKGSAPQIDIPVLPGYLPNVFVSVVLLQGRVDAPAESQEADVGRPSFKVGYIDLSVSPKEKLMSIEVGTDKKDYRDSVHVTIAVKNAAGKGVAAEVALSVADLGTLNLIGYRLPNMFDTFYAERGLAVTTTETRIHLVEQRNYGEKGEDEGGGGGAKNMLAAVNAEGIRKDFRASAYWNPSVITDDQGNAMVAFKLPDNLTAFEVMAAAHDLDAEFGYGEDAFTVSKPLLMLPALPRFARVGDTFEGGTVMFNYSEKEKTVRLVTQAEGIKFVGKDTAFYTLKPGQSFEARQTFVAEHVGKAVFTFRATTDDDSDGLQWTIPIQVPRSRETVALYESTTDPEAHEKVIIPKEIYKDLGELEFNLASTGMMGLSGGMSYLFTYPYWCLEQRVSAILPIILAKDLVEAFHFEVFKDKDYRQVVTKTLDELPSFQRANGGFAYWKNMPWTYPYISAYAVYAGVQAQRNGYAVDKKMMDAGFRYLKRVLRGEERVWYDNPWISNCTKALILYTFALAGQPDYGYMEQLYRDEKKSANENVRLPLFAKAYLLKALYAAKGNAAMIEDLARDLTNEAKVAPTSAHFEERNAYAMEWIFSSNTRTTALVLQALIETQPENALIPKVVRWLLDARRSGCWRTTQENLYVVDALATYFKTYEKDEPDFRAEVKLAGGDLITELFKGRSFKTASARVAIGELTLGTLYPVDILKEGKGRVYYGIRMNYYPKGESKAKEEGLSVLKSMETLKGSVPAASTFKAGTMVRVTLTVVSNQARNYVVVEDPLPAGFETVNLSFETTGRNLADLLQHNNKEWWYRNPFQYTEMHDDRVLLFADYLPAGVHTFSYLARVTSFGTFEMPSTRAEGMYEPEVFGQTSSRQIVVQ